MHDAYFKPHGQPNVHGMERMGSALAGTTLAAVALRRGGAAGMIGLLAAAGLLGRAVTGRCAVKRMLQPSAYEREIAREHGWKRASATAPSVTINRPRDELYRYWRDFSHLGGFMEHIEQVEVLDDTRSRWTVKAPMGQTVQWISRVTEDRPGERIAWETEAGADVPNAGWVEFRDAPGGRGTEVHAMLAYEPPGGELGRLAAKLSGREPGMQARSDLRRFKQLMETGEVASPATWAPA